jgi:phosphatidylserine/phosphatidylglycerophosphate/cardiolipin synthase-like enzyme
MHDKFAIFDGRLLVTGSYNWTESAEAANFENALFLDDPGLVARYADAFERLFARPVVRPTARPARSRPRPAARSSGS